MQSAEDAHVSLEKSYVERCKFAKTEPRKEVVNALKVAEDTGVLDLSSINLNLWSWQTLGKLLASSCRIRKLNLSNCLIPPRGIAAIFAVLSQGTYIEDLDLRGNNIQTSSVSYLSKMIRYNISLKRISLEWNCIGLLLDTFTLFCDGLAVNQMLEVLDLRNNQLNVDCAPALANALAKNSSLKCIDLRWNNLGWRGGQLLYSALQTNQSLIKIKLQGNCIPLELTTAIDQCALHNTTRATLLEECAQRTELLSQQLRKAEEERVREIQNLAQRSEEKVQLITQASQSRIEQMENQVAEKDKYIKELEKQVKTINEESQKRFDLVRQLQLQLKERDSVYQELLQESRKDCDDFNKKLSTKDEEILDLQNDLKAKLTAEQKRRQALEAVNISQSEEITRLEGELIQVKDRLARSRKQFEEHLELQKASDKELLDLETRENEKRLIHLQSELTAQKNSLQMRISELERSLEEKEHLRADLNSVLSRERARREEEISLAVQETKMREASRVAQLEDRLTTLREERLQFEKQLMQTQNQIQQLQQQNSSLIAEMADSQKKFSTLHEELSSERLNCQRLRQELADENSKLQSKSQAADKLQSEVDRLHQQVSDLLRGHLDIKHERQVERERLETLMEQRDREIENIRAQEVERANNLYAAFSKYLSSVSTSPSKTHISHS
ncbi:hypothetical protein R5R35_002169 [Gryllus longicercus]|uniref:Leucine-rich repeat-containing protein 45 n=1 Tax=Gryllus longicercus TaxID=2509291 RepID=A0AAN9Z411_9ORTH